MSLAVTRYMPFAAALYHPGSCNYCLQQWISNEQGGREQ